MVLATLLAASTSDDYTSAATVEARGARGCDITISNNAVIMQIAYEQMPGVPGQYGREERLTPRLLSISDEAIYGVRFKSAVISKPAVIDVSLLSG